MEKTKLVPVYKSDVTNYRPISILPVLSKIIEKAVYTQLKDYLEKHNLLQMQSQILYTEYLI